MIEGHGDDIFRYGDKIRANFSSNVYNHFSHRNLVAAISDWGNLIAHYPEPVPRALEKTLAGQLGVTPENIMVTNGATEAIYLTAMAFRGKRSAVVIPTFTEYADACRLHSHRLSYARSLAEVTDEMDVVWVCNPNNPTGQVFAKDLLLECFRGHKNVVFVVDASYAPFTALPLLTPEEACRMPNVVMIHSMTKAFAVPGLRLGYITACPALLEPIGRCRMPWSVGSIAIAAGLWLTGHREEYSLPLAQLLEERQRVSLLLNQLGGCDVAKSDTHILLCRLHHGTAAELKDFLIDEHGLLIRDASNFHGLDSSYFRIAVQTSEENDLLIEGIRSYLEKVDDRGKT